VDDQEFEARLRVFDERDKLFLDQLETFDRRHRESEERFHKQLADFDRRHQDLVAKDVESDRRFQERLDLYDQRDTALLRRLERLREQVDLLSGQSGQIADDLVEHKRDPNAHG
jgi:hypothetical protein